MEYGTQEEVSLDPKTAMNELEMELSKIVGLDDLKYQLNSRAKGLIMDERRQQLGIKVRKRKPPHMTFLGNPGTGKTSVARILGKLLYNLRVLPNNKVVEVQRTDLVGEYIGQTGPKTKKKIQDAEGGILFVDEAYRLIVTGSKLDFGKEALEEIMHAMDSGKLSIVLAGYEANMQHLFDSNDGLSRRVHTFVFQDSTCKELAKILHLKMSQSDVNDDEYSFLDGFKLDPKCNIDVVASLIQSKILKEQRVKMNGGLVDQVLMKARENLDRRLEVDCVDQRKLITIMLEDLKALILLLKKNYRENSVQGK